MAIKYFTDAFSATGYISLQKKNLTGINHVYHLKNPADALVHDALEHLAMKLTARRLSLEYIFNTHNPNQLAGLVIRELGIAFVSGDTVMETAEIIDLSTLYCKSRIKKNQVKLDELNNNMQLLYDRMYMHFNAALHIHDEWEKIYIDRIDFKKAELFKESLLDRLFAKVSATDHSSTIVKRFFGTFTPQGLVDFIPELTAGFTRYLIKGRPGTGKSTLLMAVVKKALELGLDMHIYHCSLDVKSLDMVIVPELGFCIFDATSPHEYEPSLKRDEVLDTYDAFIKKDTDERCACILRGIEDKYNNQIKSAKNALKEASKIRAEIEDIYTNAEIANEKKDLFYELINKLKKII